MRIPILTSYLDRRREKREAAERLRLSAQRLSRLVSPRPHQDLGPRTAPAPYRSENSHLQRQSSDDMVAQNALLFGTLATSSDPAPAYCSPSSSSDYSGSSSSSDSSSSYSSSFDSSSSYSDSGSSSF